MADLIDRDALLLKQKAHADLFADSTVHDDIVRRDEATAALAEIINAPAVNSWIPCSERLPEKAGRYLCYLYYAVPPYHLLHPERDTYVHDVSIQDFDGKSFISAVVAWMPLPEPPEEVQDDDER